MAEFALTRQLTRLQLAYERSAARRFLAWWGRELSALLPARVAAWFAERRPEWRLRLDADALVLESDGEPRRFPRGDAQDESRAALAGLLQSREEPPALVLLLPRARVLRRRLTLPAAVEENLRQVLGFEMDRQTPFRADQVYFDARVLARDAASKQIEVDLLLVPRPVADAELSAAEALGLRLDGLDAADEDGRLGFNLLPTDRRAPRRNLWLRINLALGAAALVLLVLAMLQSLTNRETALESLREATEKARAEARSVAQLRTALNDAVEGANYLAARKRSRPPVVTVLRDVTRRLPNDTWLQRFSVNGEQVQLQGQSREASALIALLQQSELLDGPALQGAITPDARTGKEQFLIQARARLPEAAPAAAADERTAGTASSEDAEGGDEADAGR